MVSSSWGMSEPIPIPERPFDILDNYCLNCHDDVEFKGEINLDMDTVQWSEEDAIHLWSRVIKMVESGDMPPKKKKQPSKTERAELASWMDGMLSRHSPIGGTAIRRLNRREYLHSINELFDIDYQLPNGFPRDNEANGFDNQADALALSGALLESYSEVAVELAEPMRRTGAPRPGRKPRCRRRSASSPAAVRSGPDSSIPPRPRLPERPP